MIFILTTLQGINGVAARQRQPRERRSGASLTCLNPLPCLLGRQYDAHAQEAQDLTEKSTDFFLEQTTFFRSRNHYGLPEQEVLLSMR